MMEESTLIKVHFKRAHEIGRNFEAEAYEAEVPHDFVRSLREIFPELQRSIQLAGATGEDDLSCIIRVPQERMDEVLTRIRVEKDFAEVRGAEVVDWMPMHATNRLKYSDFSLN